jgi:hypothetical protein
LNAAPVSGVIGSSYKVVERRIDVRSTAYV